MEDRFQSRCENNVEQSQHSGGGVCLKAWWALTMMTKCMIEEAWSRYEKGKHSAI